MNADFPVILDACVLAKIGGDLPVDERVICSGVAAHQVHGVPVFLALLRIEKEPGETGQFAGSSGCRDMAIRRSRSRSLRAYRSFQHSALPAPEARSVPSTLLEKPLSDGSFALAGRL